jgi:hypothetical protein
MNRDVIIDLVAQVDMAFLKRTEPWNMFDKYEAFAALVRSDEREACAKVCDARYMGDNNREDMEARRCAEAIRARGQT